MSCQIILAPSVWILQTRKNVTTDNVTKRAFLWRLAARNASIEIVEKLALIIVESLTLALARFFKFWKKGVTKGVAAQEENLRMRTRSVGPNK